MSSGLQNPSLLAYPTNMPLTCFRWWKAVPLMLSFANSPPSALNPKEIRAAFRLQRPFFDRSPPRQPISRASAQKESADWGRDGQATGPTSRCAPRAPRVNRSGTSPTISISSLSSPDFADPPLFSMENWPHNKPPPAVEDRDGGVCGKQSRILSRFLWDRALGRTQATVGFCEQLPAPA